MIVQHLSRLLALTEEIRDAARGHALVTIPFGGKLPSLDAVKKPPHDYETFVAKVPERCRIVRVIFASDVANNFNVRHALFGPHRIAQFHGGELPGLMFTEAANVTLAWPTILEKGDPVEMNLVPKFGTETEVRGVLLGLPVAAVRSLTPEKKHETARERWEKRAKGGR